MPIWFSSIRAFFRFSHVDPPRYFSDCSTPSFSSIHERIKSFAYTLIQPEYLFSTVASNSPCSRNSSLSSSLSRFVRRALTFWRSLLRSVDNKQWRKYFSVVYKSEYFCIMCAFCNTTKLCNSVLTACNSLCGVCGLCVGYTFAMLKLFNHGTKLVHALWVLRNSIVLCRTQAKLYSLIHIHQEGIVYLLWVNNYRPFC